MGNVSESLKRKLGPFPVWVWAIIGGLLLYVVRARGASVSAGTGTNSVQATQAEAQLVQAEAQASAATMQSPQILAGGESVYDPNTGALLGTSQNSGLQDSLIGLIGALLIPQPRGAISTQPMRVRGLRGIRARPKHHLKKNPKHPGHNPKTEKPGKKRHKHHDKGKGGN